MNIRECLENDMLDTPGTVAYRALQGALRDDRPELWSLVQIAIGEALNQSPESYLSAKITGRPIPAVNIEKLEAELATEPRSKPEVPAVRGDNFGIPENLNFKSRCPSNCDPRTRMFHFWVNGLSWKAARSRFLSNKNTCHQQPTASQSIAWYRRFNEVFADTKNGVDALVNGIEAATQVTTRSEQADAVSRMTGIDMGQAKQLVVEQRERIKMLASLQTTESRSQYKEGLRLAFMKMMVDTMEKAAMQDA